MASTPVRPGERRMAEASGTTPDDVIANHELLARPARPPNFQSENEALTALLRKLSASPESLLQELVNAVMRLTGADSAGISLLERREGHSVFVWRATAGVLAPLVGSVLPRDFSPCGEVIDRNAPQLMIAPVRHYAYMAELPEPASEVLLVPFHFGEQPIGTLWMVAHDSEKQFDAEDARVAASLSHVAALAWRGVQAAPERGEGATMGRGPSSPAGVGSAPELNAEEQARLTQARFAAFFDQSPFYAAILAEDGRVLEISRTALQSCGYSRGEVLGRPFWKTGWWHGSAEVQNQVEVAFRGAIAGRVFKAKLPYFFATGEERVTDFGLSPVYDERGRVSFVIATGRDVTDQVKAERELRDARKRLDSALIAAELGVYEWEVQSDRLFGDENFARMFEVHPGSDGSAPLSSYLNVIHPDDRERAARLVERSLATGENFQADYRVCGSRGERWINSRGRLVHDDQGNVVSFLGVVLDITERKVAEQERERIANELRRLTAIHETVLSSTNDFAYIFDRKGRFLYANRPLLTVWGLSLPDIVGKTCYELGYPTWHADMHMREIAHVIATREPIRGEVPFTGANGATGHYDYIFTPVFSPEGEVELVAGTTRDVTERRRGEDRDRFLVQLDDATRPLTDPREITQASARLLGEYLRVNRCAYADVEADENTFNLTGDYNRGVPSIVGRYRFDQFGEDCLRAMRAGEPFVVEDAETDPRVERVRDAYEATRIRSVICVSLKKAGQFVAAMAVHQDSPRVWLPVEIELVQLVANRCWESIERSRVTRALAESEQQLRLAIETAGLGVWEIDLEANQLRCSDSCKLMFGQPVGVPFTIETFWNAVHEDDRKRLRDALHQAVKERVKFELEYQIRWPDGTLHWLLVRGHATYSVAGNPQRITGVNLDITSRKQAERELGRLHDEAVRASRAKDDFLAALSHELRTPLNPVLLLASEAAEDPLLPASARDAFAVIRRNVELEARLIDDLLDLTTIERGKLTVRKAPVDVNALVTQAVTALRQEFLEKGISVETKLDAPSGTVLGDADRLLQIVLNLVRNAVKFTPSGGAVVLVTQMAETGELEIRVTDTGIGMTPGELERVFEAFEQGDHAAGRGGQTFGGLGLGLSIAQRLVQLHQGTIVAVSQGRNRGSSFIVRLPVHGSTGSADRSGGPGTDRSPAALGSGTRVLLVEDHEATRTALQHLLKRRGYQVWGAGSLAEARVVVDQHPVDLLISDIGLPDGDGTTLMAELRQRLELQGIALTGYGMAEDVARSMRAGFSAHLTKPVNIRSLEAALAKVRSATAKRPG